MTYELQMAGEELFRIAQEAIADGVTVKIAIDAGAHEVEITNIIPDVSPRLFGFCTARGETLYVRSSSLVMVNIKRQRQNARD